MLWIVEPEVINLPLLLTLQSGDFARVLLACGQGTANLTMTRCWPGGEGQQGEKSRKSTQNAVCNVAQKIYFLDRKNLTNVHI